MTIKQKSSKAAKAEFFERRKTDKVYLLATKLKPQLDLYREKEQRDNK